MLKSLWSKDPVVQELEMFSYALVLHIETLEVLTGAQEVKYVLYFLLVIYEITANMVQREIYTIVFKSS